MSPKTQVNIFTLVLFFLDRISKLIAFHSGIEFNIIPHLLAWKLLLNNGIAFGLPLPTGTSLIAGAVIILVILILLVVNYYSWNKTLLLACELLLIGAASNFWDKLYLGRVIDFLQIFSLNVFNLADLFILIGAGILIYYQLKK